MSTEPHKETKIITLQSQIHHSSEPHESPTQHQPSQQNTQTVVTQQVSGTQGVLLKTELI